jgi:diguanylate cyclase (GGDEF)-like protein
MRVLLVEDNPGDADLLEEALAASDEGGYELVKVDRLEAALERLRQDPFDAVLLDLSLPDSQGLETFTRLRLSEPAVPVVVLTGLNDKQVSAQAVRQGAQDYLIKARINAEVLERALRYAVERQRLLTEISANSLTDELTGLYNRRGLLTVTAAPWKGAPRQKKGMTLLYIDLDNMKRINDALGHKAGDQALVETAEVLRQTFRQADILARLGGDEFAVLAVGTPASAGQVLAERLQQVVRAHNAAGPRRFELSLSVGLAQYDPERPCSLQQLLAQADARMYEVKQVRRQARSEAPVR